MEELNSSTSTTEDFQTSNIVMYNNAIKLMSSHMLFTVLYFTVHHHHHVACPMVDVAVPTSLLHACRF